MQIKRTLAFANLILHTHDLEIRRFFDALIGPHKVLGSLADEGCAHHIRHELRIRPLILFFAILGDFYGNAIGPLRWPDLELDTRNTCGLRLTLKDFLCSTRRLKAVLQHE